MVFRLASHPPFAAFWRSLPRRIWLTALFAAVVIALLVTAASKKITALDRLEYWTADWRTALFAKSQKRQHAEIALVLVDEETLERFNAPARSPTDRALLAQLIEAIGAAHPRAIGLDFVFDQMTANDAALLIAIRSAKSPIALGIVLPPAELRPKQIAFQDSFLKQAGRPFGFVNIATEFDGVVRFQGESTLPPGVQYSFAEQLVRVAGKAVPHEPRRIAWLRDTKDGEEAFLTLPGFALLPGQEDLPAALTQGIQKLKDRIVIVGLDLYDQGDRHWTPLSNSTGERSKGVAIQAQLAAQIWDGRTYSDLGTPYAFIFALVLAFAGVLLGNGEFKHEWFRKLAPPIGFIVADVIAFTLFATIIPFAASALAWSLGIFAGWALPLADRRLRPSAS
jgi:CHASE2 domain-containing sensor protein